MEAVVGLLVMLLGVCHGVESRCDGRQEGAQCYGALGGTVVLQLMDRASERFRYQWFKNNTSNILNVLNNRIVNNKMENRSLFTPSDGTFRINNLSRSDGDKYLLKIFNSSGRFIEQRTLQLSIEAPVSSVLLKPECLSQGELRVSCSSEGGDSPQYSWTLDGRTLTDAELLSENNETNSITLKQHVSGLLVCSVRNHISRVSNEVNIATCGYIFINCTSSNGTNISEWVYSANNTLCIEPTTTTPTTVIEASTVGKKSGTTVSVKPSTNITLSNQTNSSKDDPWYIRYLPIMAGVLSALVILLVVGVTIVFVHRKKQNNNAKEEGDDQEMIYADVKIVQRPGRQVQQKAEVEVEYGQVNFSRRSRQTVEPTENDCVYAQVRNSR